MLIKIFLNLPLSFSKSIIKLLLNFIKLAILILENWIVFLKLNCLSLYKSYVLGEKIKDENNEKITNIEIIKIIGFLISLIDNPKQCIAIISLSLENFRKERTIPNININGRTKFIRLGTIIKDKFKISNELICKWFITENSLDNCKSHAIDIKIKKTSVQDFTIWLNMYKFILFILCQ